jgi:hypothetical protein
MMRSSRVSPTARKYLITAMLFAVALLVAGDFAAVIGRASIFLKSPGSRSARIGMSRTRKNAGNSSISWARIWLMSVVAIERI